MRVALAGGRQRPLHRSLGVTFVGAALVRRESAALTVRKLGFFELGHPTVPASVERKRRRKSGIVAQPSDQFRHAAL